MQNSAISILQAAAQACADEPPVVTLGHMENRQSYTAMEVTVKEQLTVTGSGGLRLAVDANFYYADHVTIGPGVGIIKAKKKDAANWGVGDTFELTFTTLEKTRITEVIEITGRTDGTSKNRSAMERMPPAVKPAPAIKLTSAAESPTKPASATESPLATEQPRLAAEPPPSAAEPAPAKRKHATPTPNTEIKLPTDSRALVHEIQALEVKIAETNSQLAKKRKMLQTMQILDRANEELGALGLCLMTYTVSDSRQSAAASTPEHS